ncbi:HEAT repeat-containing protein 1-like isoform X2 [Dreissena polymorpha]|nr:HEAT repeat-containing protein 1-like isoform X2 [Dreissena polymorpha]
MTSLAKQLQRLAVPHTQTILGEDKKKASLLFDPKEAASIDRETFHALGLNGLEELETIDASFAEFETSLYGDSSITFERSVKTKEVNEKLDLAIQRFLIKVSPFCLLKPAHKALEWLIHRFHIHFYNTDDLLICFLPYHESKIFVRVLQLIKFDSKIASKWDWLEPLQKSGVHLTRKTLVNHCRTDSAFLSFVCDAVPRYVKVLSELDQVPKCRVLFSFYTTTVIGVLESGAVTEVLLAMLVPHLSRGMQSRIQEFKAASYMILAQLLFKAKLKSSLLKTLQQVIAKNIVPDLLTEAVACLMLMFQTQDMSSVNITKKSFKCLCKHFGVIDAISQLYAQIDANDFLSRLLDRLIPAAFKHAVGIATSGESSQSESTGGLHDHMPMLHRLLSTVKLPDNIAEEAAYRFLSVYIHHGNKYLEEDVDDRIKDSLQGIVRQLEGKHSAAVDRAVSRRLSESETQHDRELVQEFLNLYVLSVPHQLVTDSETSLVLSLNHRLASVREKAVTTLIASRAELDDVGFLKDCLLLRLGDEDPEVVSAVLAVGQELWEIIIDGKTTLGLLQSIVMKGVVTKKWEVCAKQAIRLLSHYHGDIDLEIFAGCLPCMFICEKTGISLEVIQTVMTSPLVTNSPVLKDFGKEWALKSKKISGANFSAVNLLVSQCLAAGLLKQMETGALSMLNQWADTAIETKDNRLACLLMLILNELVTMTTDQKLRLDICYLQTQLIDRLHKNEQFRKAKDQFSVLEGDWAQVAKVTSLADGIPQDFGMKALQGVVDVVRVPEELTSENASWQINPVSKATTVFLQLCVRLFALILEKTATKHRYSNIYRFQIHTLNEKCFADVTHKFRFLGLLWTQHANDLASDLGLTLTIQARSLHLGQAIVQGTYKSKIKVLCQSPQVILDLLIVLTSPHAAIRKEGVLIVKTLFDQAQGMDSVFMPLLAKVIDCQGEILADKEYVQQVVYSVFNKAQQASPSKSRKKKRESTVGDHGSESTENARALSDILVLITRETTPAYLQCKALEVFSRLNNQDLLLSLLPLMDRLLSRDHVTATETLCLKFLIGRFEPQSAGCLDVSTDALRLFLQALQRPGVDTDTSAAIQLAAIGQVTRDLYKGLSDPVKQQLLCMLFDVSVDSTHIEVTSQLRRVLKHLFLDGKHVELEMRKTLKLSTARTVREAKRQRKPDPPADLVGMTEFDSRDWQRLTVVLEAVHTKKKILNVTVLVPTCFQIMASILESDNHSSAEYLKQLILMLLYNVCGRMDKSGAEDTEVVPEQQFNMDVIVSCIRSSDNPQTHHHAFILLTAAAKIYPEHLLHNMMSVFTFMGANIMRQDDAYSFLIIGKILETVIPALITACEQRKRVPKGITNDLDDIITMVIQVFVDSYPYIPEHRRHLLFNKLVAVIGERRYLWRLLLLMMKLVVTSGNLKSELDTSQESGDTEFCLLLCADFNMEVKLSSSCEILDYVLKLPDDKEDDAVQLAKKNPESFGKLHKEDVAIFSVDAHSGKQLRHFKFAAVNLVVNLYTNTDFIAQVSGCENAELLPVFQKLLEMTLKFVSHFTRLANKFSMKPTAKFWKALQNKCHDMLDKLVSLLPEAMFLDVIGGLLSHDLPTIQRKAMDLLNSKLQHQKSFQPGEVEGLLRFVDLLRGLVVTLALDRDITEESSLNCQTAFISLKLLCRNIGLQYKQPFLEVLKTSVAVFKHETSGQQVAACALLCVAELCQTLKVHVIQLLPTFMPAILASMADTKVLLQNELYVMSVVTTVNKVVENLAHFLSPYLKDILCSVCILSSKADKFDILQKPAVQQRLKTIRATLSTSLPTRVLLPVVTECYSSLVNTSKMGVVSLMSLFGDHISHITREDLASHMTSLQTFFLRCLDIRTDFPELSNKKVLELEGVTMDTIIAMVLKLSEATFKPFLFKVFDWATTIDDCRERVLVFYRLTDRLSEKLRSLFTLFAGHVVDHAAKILDENNSIKTGKKFFPSDKAKRRKSCLLLQYVLGTVTKCCLYDTQGFVTRERFDLLMQPLVDQLENMSGGEEAYRSRTKDHVVPCLVQLCTAAQDDSLWQSLNYQVCLKTRAQDPQVKLAALLTLDELHRKLGEDYMPLLPDTVPFLAELMEDESEEVEKKCHEVIRDMEKTLGEPLQKYF